MTNEPANEPANDSLNEPLKGVEQPFIDAILNAKKSLYKNTINEPKLGTEEAQSLKLLNKYLMCLDLLYQHSVKNSKNSSAIKPSNQIVLEKIPENSREIVNTALDVIFHYFKMADLDKIPYQHFIKYHLRENQFLLKE